MHELSIAESVVDAITQRTARRRVWQVRLEVGRLSGVSAESLRFCFELAAVGTGVDGALLDIDEPAGRARCAACERTFAIDDLIMMCPCGSCDVQVVSGDELRIVSVEVSR